MKKYFNHNAMSRIDLAKIYANIQGQKYDFCDKDYDWVNEYESALNCSDEWLHDWATSEGL